MLERLKLVRKTLGLTQVQFSQKLGMSQPGYSQIEKGIRNITNIIVKSVCKSFNVDENWLRTGEGEMFVQTEESMFDDFKKKYNLSDAECEVAKYFLRLDAEQRKTILDHIVNIAEVIKNTQSRPNKPDSELTREEVHKMIDQEFDDRQKGQTSTASTGTNGLEKENN